MSKKSPPPAFSELLLHTYKHIETGGREEDGLGFKERSLNKRREEYHIGERGKKLENRHSIRLFILFHHHLLFTIRLQHTQAEIQPAPYLSNSGPTQSSHFVLGKTHVHRTESFGSPALLSPIAAAAAVAVYTP